MTKVATIQEYLQDIPLRTYVQIHNLQARNKGFTVHNPGTTIQASINHTSPKLIVPANRRPCNLSLVRTSPQITIRASSQISKPHVHYIQIETKIPRPQNKEHQNEKPLVADGLQSMPAQHDYISKTRKSTNSYTFPTPADP